jgi:hypothetical protein
VILAIEVAVAVLGLVVAAGAIHGLRSWWVSRSAAAKERQAFADAERARRAADQALVKAQGDVDRVDAAARAQADKDAQGSLGDWLRSRGAGK